MSSSGKRVSVKSKTSKGSTKKSKKSSGDSGSKRVDNWRSEARALGKEKKYCDWYIAPLKYGASEILSHVPSYAYPFNPTPTGSIAIVNLVPEGNNINTRKDNAIKLRSLYIQGQFRFPNNAAAGGDRENPTNSWITPVPANTDIVIPVGMIRVAVVYDESPNGVVPSVSDLVKSAFGMDGTDGRPQMILGGANLAGTADPITLSNQFLPDAFQNMRGQGRFRLLADERMPFGGASTTAGGSMAGGSFFGNPIVHLPYHRYLKLGGIATHFSKSGATLDLSSIMKGALYVISTWTPGPETDANFTFVNPVFEGCVRLRFDD